MLRQLGRITALDVLLNNGCVVGLTGRWWALCLSWVWGWVTGSCLALEAHCSDRLPLIWDNRGNGGNFIFASTSAGPKVGFPPPPPPALPLPCRSHLQVYAIDSQVYPITDAHEGTADAYVGKVPPCTSLASIQRFLFLCALWMAHGRSLRWSRQPSPWATSGRPRRLLPYARSSCKIPFYLCLATFSRCHCYFFPTSRPLPTARFLNRQGVSWY